MTLRRPRTAAATCSLLLCSCAPPTLANHADLFFDFSSKIRVGSTSDKSSKITKSDLTAAAADSRSLVSEAAAAAKNAPASERAQAVAEVEALFAEQMEELMGLLESYYESYYAGPDDDTILASLATVSALNMTTESLLSLSAQVPANASVAEWITAYGDLISSEQRGHYCAEATGYTT